VKVLLDVRNTSALRPGCRRDTLQKLAERLCAGEGCTDEVELSLLFCDDAFITALNGDFRNKRRPTDVLAFLQEDAPEGEVRVLGDIVISLETVHRYCVESMPGTAEGRPLREAMRNEVCLLFCHGLLHLLGYDHATTAERRRMQERQAHYLGWDMEAAWRKRGIAG
jgi:probable rRNA maturation factor